MGTRRELARLFMLVAVVSWLTLGQAKAGNVRDLTFSPEDPEALVLVEERDGMRGGTLVFAPVDLEDGARRRPDFELSKATDGRLRTDIRDLQTRGEGLLVPRNMSRFSAGKTPAGDYALVSFTYYNGVATVTHCPAQGAPVYRFAPGVANLIPAEMLPAGGNSTNILDYSPARSGSNNDIPDAQTILNGYANLRAEVRIAQLVGHVLFQNDAGRASGCGDGNLVIGAPNSDDE